MSVLSTRRFQVGATVWAAWFVNFIDRQKTNSLLPLIAASLALSAEQIGWVMFAYYIGFALTQPFAGVLCDRLGPKKTVAISTATFSIFTWTMALVDNGNDLLIRNFIFGIGIGFETAPVYRLIATWFPSRERARASGWVLTGIMVASVITPFIVVPIAQATGTWRWSFMAVSFLGIPMLWAVQRFLADRPELDSRVSRAELEHIFGAEELAKKKGHALDPSKVKSESELAPGERIVSLRTIFLNRSMVLGALATFLQYMAAYGVLTWLPTYGFTELKLPLLLAGTLSSFLAIGAFISYPLGGYLSDNLLKGLRTPLWMLGGVITASILLVVANLQPGVNLIIVYAVFALIGLVSFANLNGVLTSAYTSELLTPGAVGRASSIIVFASQIGSAAAQPLVAKLIIQTPQGPQYWPVFTFFAGCSLLAVLLIAGMVEPKVKRSYIGYLLSGRKEGTWSPQSKPA